MINKEKIIDLLLRIEFVNASPAVGGAFVSAWIHGGVEYTPGLTYTKQFADMCEMVGLPRELPKPKFPQKIWAAYKVKEGKERHDIDAFEEVFSGTLDEVHDWAQSHENEYNHIGSTDRTFETEEEMFEMWKSEILKTAGSLV